MWKVISESKKMGYGRTDGRTYGRTNGPTDIPSYRDAIAASNNAAMFGLLDAAKQLLIFTEVILYAWLSRMFRLR